MSADVESAAHFFHRWLWEGERRKTGGEPWEHRHALDAIAMLEDYGALIAARAAEQARAEGRAEGLHEAAECLAALAKRGTTPFGVKPYLESSAAALRKLAPERTRPDGNE